VRAAALALLIGRAAAARVATRDLHTSEEAMRTTFRSNRLRASDGRSAFAKISTAMIVLLSCTTLISVAPAADAGGGAAVAGQTEDQRLAAFFEGIFQRDLQLSPLLQTELGIKTQDYGKWDDVSDAEAVRRNERVQADLERLRAEFDFNRLSERWQVSYRIFEFLQERALRSFPWRFHGYDFSTTRNAATYRASYLLNFHRVDTLSDAEAYVHRLQGLGRVFAQLLANMNAAAAQGVVPTSFSFDPALHETRALITGAPFDDSGKDSPLLADFRSKLDSLPIGELQKSRLLGQAVAALQGPVKSGVDALIARMRQLRPKSHGPNGVWALPNGQNYYRERVEFWTTDQRLTPDEIHEVGLREVARIRDEMQAIMRHIGFKGDLAAFFEFLRRDPANFFPNTDAGRRAYLEQTNGYLGEIYQDVAAYFSLRPRAALEARAVEKWREETAPFAFYERPAMDGSRPGILYVNLKDMANRQKHEMETLAYHEGAPGHHFQVALAQELEGLPSFQRRSFFGAYIEGWACYAELLAKETGRFKDPMQDFGRLQFDMLRASRLVVDSGAHARKWSREQMIDYMMANNPMTLENARKEVERYLDLPGQALAYKVGMIRILDLREKARRELGSKFAIRDFHDVVLKHGAVPLPILEDLVNQYIVAGKGR
jgi:uncharacterized protein (DUF885 family)